MTMTNVNTVTDGEFQESVLDSDTPVLVDFWAEWCVPCHMVSPVVEEIGQDKGEALKAFLTWALENGDSIAQELNYAPIGDSLQEKSLANVARINEGG